MKLTCKTCATKWEGDPFDGDMKHPFLQSALVRGNEIVLALRYSYIYVPVYEFVIKVDYVRDGLICDGCLKDLMNKGNIKYFDESPTKDETASKTS